MGCSDMRRSYEGISLCIMQEDVSPGSEVTLLVHRIELRGSGGAGNPSGDPVRFIRAQLTLEGRVSEYDPGIERVLTLYGSGCERRSVYWQW
jgi:hypothetical protein